ncbi:PLP-dependent aminotransferase family protein [Halonatronum saccharophilum]|uniref:aminotransferase-like domain-containing protein n=1 Tax=Halonatronum saccharophilum TaxID=150060 RepID=UPI000484E00A|nr:PLP-dependent aminotransferase family protein [Halonatronum saccharophilum]
MKEKLADRLEEMENKELGDLMRIIGRDDLISFAGGIPDPAVFPTAKLNRITKEVLDEKQEIFYQYSSTEGDDLLRDYLVEFLTKGGLNPKREELIVTSGSQQALDLVAKLFLNPGDKIVIEKPAYVGAIGTFKSYQAKIKEVPVEEDGLKVQLLEEYLQGLKEKGESIKFLYSVPDYSNPSGARLSLKKRKEVLRLAEEYDFYIIEDTPYSELNYYDQRLDYIKSYDSTDRVILLGSFSKFFVPGFRIAWIHSSSEFIELASKAKQNTDLASATAGQLILCQAGKEGLLGEQIERVAEFYRPRLEAMSEALDKYFPATAEWFKPKGGFFFWVKLPEGFDSRDLLKEALEEKVAFVTGSAFTVDSTEGSKYIRLSFSNSKPEDIEKGIKILGRLIKGYQDLEL